MLIIFKFVFHLVGRPLLVVLLVCLHLLLVRRYSRIVFFLTVWKITSVSEDEDVARFSRFDPLQLTSFLYSLPPSLDTSSIICKASQLVQQEGKSSKDE